MNISEMNPELEEARAALMLSALGSEIRLRLYKLLVRAGPPGMSVGRIKQRLEIPASTLAHHIAALCNAGLITQRREGRTILNSANYEEMDHLVKYLTDACCADM